MKISQFLNKSNEGSGSTYNNNLTNLKKALSNVPNSYAFLNDLVNVTPPNRIILWRRGDPIENTPRTHMIHAYYYRVFVKSCFSRRDRHMGLPRPNIFVAEHSIMSDLAPNTIRRIDYLYTMVKPFGFDFPDTLVANGITFKLHELFNPLYVREVLGEGPTPIIRNGFKSMPISNKNYTILYKNYIKQISER